MKGLRRSSVAQFVRFSGVEMGQHMVNRECKAVVVKEEPSFHSVPVDDIIEISDSSDEGK